MKCDLCDQPAVVHEVTVRNGDTLVGIRKQLIAERSNLVICTGLIHRANRLGRYLREGDVLRVEKLEAEAGSTIEFDHVLMVGEGADVTLGKPVIEGAKVTAQVSEHGKGRKIIIVKFKRRQDYRRTQGHRQPYTEIRITGISA